LNLEYTWLESRMILKLLSNYVLVKRIDNKNHDIFSTWPLQKLLFHQTTGHCIFYRRHYDWLNNCGFDAWNWK